MAELMTRKQANFISIICSELKIDVSTLKIKTKKEASEWISSHIDKFNEIQDVNCYDTNDFEMFGMCDDLLY